MFSHRYPQFPLCGIALFITHASASASSNDTSTDDKVSCVYPISGVYGLLSRVLFYASLTFAVLGQRFEWLVIGALASAMTFSATAAIHIIIIFATHGRHPPILDLDAVSIALIAIASVSMFPALICFSSALQKNRAGRVVITLWFFTMVIAYVLALLVLFDTGAQHSNAAVPCFFLDKTMLTSLAQLNEARDLECIYDCFLTRGSILKPQDAAMAPSSTHFFEPPDSHELGKTPEASSDDGFASTGGDDSRTPPSSQRRSFEEETASHGCTPDAAAGRTGVVSARDLAAYTPRWERRCPERRLAPGGNSATDMRGKEADIGGYGIPLADR
ncbi:hypothetical protein O988_09795, partial [Pseudogymnoascus sp. VKM F-3808]